MSNGNGTKEVKEAEIIINGEVIEIMGTEVEQAWEFTRHLDEEETLMLIERLREKMFKIDRKLELSGYFFNEDIINSEYEPEIIVYLLNNIFGKHIDSIKKFGTGGKALYYDPTFKKRDGSYIMNMLEELFKKHYGEN